MKTIDPLRDGLIPVAPKNIGDMHYINSMRNRKKESRPHPERRLDPLEPFEPPERERTKASPVVTSDRARESANQPCQE
jgi:hypothetical protein